MGHALRVVGYFISIVIIIVGLLFFPIGLIGVVIGIIFIWMLKREASGERSEKSIKQQEKCLKEMRENDRDRTFRELADREREKDHKD